jgi:branched-chain amino acid transport system permease protein
MEKSGKFKELAPWIALILVFSLVPVLKTSDYHLTLANHMLVWGLFAVSFNMLFGQTGMLSFGQALYFGLGAYFTGLMVDHYGSALFLPGMAMGVAAAALLALAIGPLTIRVTGVYFTVLTLAFGQLAWGITFKWYEFTGGDDGIQGILPPGLLDNPVVYYYFTLVLVLASVWFLYRVANSPFGVILRCIRQNPDRVRFLGRRVRLNQLGVYVLAGVFGALAGGLMAGVDGSIHTDMFFWTTSGEVILMSVLGGIGQFFGPFLGAILIILIEDIVGAYTEYWSFIIGSVMLTMVILFPMGVLGEIQKLRARMKARRSKREILTEAELGTDPRSQ